MFCNLFWAVELLRIIHGLIINKYFVLNVNSYILWCKLILDHVTVYSVTFDNDLDSDGDFVSCILLVMFQYLRRSSWMGS